MMIRDSKRTKMTRRDSKEKCNVHSDRERHIQQQSNRHWTPDSSSPPQSPKKHCLRSFRQIASSSVQGCTAELLTLRIGSKKWQNIAGGRREARLTTCDTAENVETIRQIVHDDRRIAIREIADVVNMSFGEVQMIRTSTSKWMLHDYNAPAHRALATRQFCTRNKMPLFPKMKFNLERVAVLALWKRSDVNSRSLLRNAVITQLTFLLHIFYLEVDLVGKLSLDSLPVPSPAIEQMYNFEYGCTQAVTYVCLFFPPVYKCELKTNAHKDKGKEYTRHFQASQYQKTQWIAGSAKLNKLFCWPCLMFSKEETVWSKNGYDNLNNLHNAINKHEKSQAHIFSVLQFKSFGSSRIDVQLDSQLRVSVEQHNEMVRKNREILKRLIDTVCFLAMHELSFRGHCESEEAVNKGVYLGALNYLAKYDLTLSHLLQTSTTFRGTSNRIQNDLILAVSDVVMDNIKQELSKTSFVAIMLDETSDIMNASQLSTTLSKSSKRTQRLKEYTSKKMPRHAPTRWNFTSRLVQTVKEHRDEFIGFFQDILDDSSTWDSETVVTAQGFLTFLTSFETSLLLVIFNPQKYEEYRVNFPATIFNILKENHSDTFDFIRLKNELIVLYSYDEFSGQHPYQLVNTLKKKQLDTALPEVYKLGLLIVTIPSTTASVERTFSALRRIKSYQRSTQSQERLNGLALLSIEKGLLHTVIRSATFYEDVIKKFTKQERRMDFTFK
ncbi:hypothetical protein ANN_15263 [Periplaneta americana]|uniref:Uncharacterized protein n=1 Tax=Periplaneta americana TaxID=6978 RepID=A0ABQ8SGQ0_PERAM|nr:hypothetical protein ANN_15263 [Periplaneta americana]